MALVVQCKCDRCGSVAHGSRTDYPMGWYRLFRYSHTTEGVQRTVPVADLCAACGDRAHKSTNDVAPSVIDVV